MTKLESMPITGSEGLNRLFIDHANQQIIAINALIEEYNLLPAASRAERSELTKQIDALRFNLIDKKPQDVIVKAFNEQIETGLFEDCQRACSDLGLQMYEQSLMTSGHAASTDPFAQELANMSTKDCIYLLKLLSNPFNQEVKTALTQQFTSLRNYDISVLGGKHCKNFVFQALEPPPPGPTFVVRVDNRLGQSRMMDTYLRENGFEDILAPMIAVRSHTFSDHQTNSLVMTTLCPNGTPTDLALTCSSYADRHNTALELFTQMAEIFSRFEAADIFFPDAKNDNWLIDDHGKLVIIDTKSLLFSSHQKFDPTLDKNLWLPSRIQTRGHSPRGIFTPNCDVSKAHSYLLGSNLCEFYLQNLGGASVAELADLLDNPEGKKICDLIDNLKQKSAESRTTMQEALAELKQIKRLDPAVEAARIACKTRLNQLKAVCDNRDRPLVDCLQFNRSNLHAAQTQEEIKTISDAIKTLEDQYNHSIWVKHAEFSGPEYEGFRTAIYAIPLDQRWGTHSYEALLEIEHAKVACRKHLVALENQSDKNDPKMQAFLTSSAGLLDQATSLATINSITDQITEQIRVVTLIEQANLACQHQLAELKTNCDPDDGAMSLFLQATLEELKQPNTGARIAEISKQVTVIQQENEVVQQFLAYISSKNPLEYLSIKQKVQSIAVGKRGIDPIQQETSRVLIQSIVGRLTPNSSNDQPMSRYLTSLRMDMQAELSSQAMDAIYADMKLIEQQHLHMQEILESIASQDTSEAYRGAVRNALYAMPVPERTENNVNIAVDKITAEQLLAELTRRHDPADSAIGTFIEKTKSTLATSFDLMQIQLMIQTIQEVASQNLVTQNFLAQLKPSNLSFFYDKRTFVKQAIYAIPLEERKNMMENQDLVTLLKSYRFGIGSTKKLQDYKALYQAIVTSHQVPRKPRGPVSSS